MFNPFLSSPSSTLRRSSLLALVLTLSSLGTASLTAQEQADPYKKQTPAPAEALAAPVPKKGQGQLPTTKDEPSKQLSITVEWLEIPSTEATPLTRQGLPLDSPQLIASIRQLEAAGKATLVNSTMVCTRSGQRSVVEGTKEHIYPTEFETVAKKEVTELNLSGVQPKEGRIAVSLEAPATPTPKAFEMRPVGTRMETDAVLGLDGKTIDISISPEWVRFVGNSTEGLANLGEKLVPQVQQPIFISSKFTSMVTIVSGNTLVAAIAPAIKDDGTIDPSKKVFILVHALVFP